jgi:single-strand DNA-binding protein
MMGKSVNKVILLGHAGRGPEVHILRSGTLVNLSLATSERYEDNRGEWQERTEWHNLVGYQRVGEILRDYVQKGSRIFVEGELRTRSWEDRESGQRKFRTEVVVHEVSLLSSGAAANSVNGPEPHANGNGFVPQDFIAEREIEASEVPY